MKTIMVLIWAIITTCSCMVFIVCLMDNNVNKDWVRYSLAILILSVCTLIGLIEEKC